MNGPTALEDRVRTTLQRKADQIDGPAPGYSSGVVHAVELDDTRRPSYHLVFAAAAIVVALAIGAAVVLATKDDAGRSASRVHSRPGATADGASPAVSDPIGPALAPHDLPSGLELWGMETRLDVGAQIFTTQLFGVVDATGAPNPGILLRIQPGAGGAVGAPLTVRGVSGSSSAPKEGVKTSETISWSEAGAAISATVRGLSRADAIAALNSLHLRSADALDGYDAGSLPILGETLVKSRRPQAIAGTFQYASGPLVGGAEAPLRVETSTHADYPGYLGFWIEGTRGEDGSVVKQDPGWGLNVAWPDGRQVLVYSKTDDWPTLERVARSATLTESSELADMRAAIQRRFETLPVILSASVGESTAELRGTGTPAVLCLDVGDTKRCGSPFVSGTAAPADSLQASALVDGSWRLVIASRTPMQIRAGIEPANPDLARHITANGWDFAFADVPSDLRQVTVLVGPDYRQGYGVIRPSS